MNDVQIYGKAASLLESGENVALITVVSATGSTPGKVGYKMLVWGADAKTQGTVGGGRTEAEVIEAAKNVLCRTGSETLRFDFAGTGDDERGICSGSAEFLVEAFDKSSLPLFKKLSAAVAGGRKAVLVSRIWPRGKPQKFFFDDLDQIDSVGDANFSAEAVESISKLAATEESAKVTLADGVEIFIETIARRPMLLIFGAGHIACYIARLAKPLGFQVTVCDERPEYANSRRFPDADNVVAESYQSVFDKIDVGSNTYIVIVTRGHKCDETVLEQAVRKNARYVGMIGSKRKTLNILKSLMQKGIPAEKLRRVYSPIGISIGAVTPQEIALSIVCELTKVRRLGDPAEIGHMKLDFERQAGPKNL